MVAGILLIALPVAVIGANFHRVFNRTRSQTKEGQDGGPAIKFHSSRLAVAALRGLRWLLFLRRRM